MISQFGITISSSRSISSSLPLSLVENFVLVRGLISAILILDICTFRIVTIVEIKGLATKLDIVQKIEIPSCYVAKSYDLGGTSYLVDEVLITLVNVVLS